MKTLIQTCWYGKQRVKKKKNSEINKNKPKESQSSQVILGSKYVGNSIFTHIPHF
jgi:hypothetical protein